MWMCPTSHLPGSTKEVSPTVPKHSCRGPACGASVQGSHGTAGVTFRPLSVRATWKLAIEYGQFVSLSECKDPFLLKGLGPMNILIFLLSF